MDAMEITAVDVETAAADVAAATITAADRFPVCAVCGNEAGSVLQKSPVSFGRQGYIIVLEIYPFFQERRCPFCSTRIPSADLSGRYRLPEISPSHPEGGYKETRIKRLESIVSVCSI